MKAKNNTNLTFVFLLAGIALAVMVLGGYYVLAVWIPRNSTMGEAIENIQDLSRAPRIYAFDFDDRLPVVSCWMDGLTPYTPLNSHPFHSPSLARSTGNPNLYGVLMNIQYSGLSSLEVPPKITPVIFFEGTLTERNASGKFPDQAVSREVMKGKYVVPISSFNHSYGFYYPQSGRIDWLDNYTPVMIGKSSPP